MKLFKKYLLFGNYVNIRLIFLCVYLLWKGKCACTCFVHFTSFCVYVHNIYVCMHMDLLIQCIQNSDLYMYVCKCFLLTLM